jgi:hypothetical protein
MASSDIAVEILTDIRDEIRGTNTRLDATNARLDGVSERLDGVTERLDGVTERLDVVATTLLNLTSQHGFLVRDTRTK